MIRTERLFFCSDSKKTDVGREEAKFLLIGPEKGLFGRFLAHKKHAKILHMGIQQKK